ncbi:hypothetical protein [Streptomyces boncukensis]|uniref:Uncharacterized protein n=1 Tax=Streptomyces boncukensis TaxID=2711219 RepID=A0A6G4WUG2_9ACTN|nr:hypothetical protein [Streptomyces boncukensis]NGO68270.1 hypothetical protein [Streptomyces boncukensis]
MTSGTDAGTWAVPADAAASAPRAGRLWDAVRVVRPVGLDAVLRLRGRGVAVGPVLDVPPRGALEFVVPAGTAESWPPLPGTTCVRSGRLPCPVPHTRSAEGQWVVRGRRWIVPLGSTAAFTDPDELAETVTGAAAHRAFAWLGWNGPRYALMPG